MSRLSIAKIKGLEAPGRYADGGTLYLVVAPGGSKHFVQRLTIEGTRRDIGLGGWPVVTLQEARDAALDNRRLVRKGIDPRAAKRKSKREQAMPTFREATAATHAALRTQWRNASHARGWLSTVETYAYPVMGELRVDRIERADVLAALTPIWNAKPETARRVRQRIRTVLSRCQAEGHIKLNMAGEIISAALPKHRNGKKHFRALPFSELPAALETIEQSRASEAAKLALRFLVLTASRTGEVLGATWEEIDLDANTWTIPDGRMKAGRAHRIPLPEAAVRALRDAERLSGGEGLIFPSPRKPGAPLSNMALTKVMRDNGLAEQSTVHGFRSSFRDWCAETGKRRELAEAALAHVVQGVEGAYFRSDLFEQRRAVMDGWAAHATRSAAKVVQLRTGTAA